MQAITIVLSTLYLCILVIPVTSSANSCIRSVDQQEDTFCCERVSSLVLSVRPNQDQCFTLITVERVDTSTALEVVVLFASMIVTKEYIRACAITIPTEFHPKYR